MQVCTNIFGMQVNPEPFTVYKRMFIEIVRWRKIRGSRKVSAELLI